MKYTFTMKFETNDDISREQCAIFQNALLTLARDIFRGTNVEIGHMALQCGHPEPTLFRNMTDVKKKGWVQNDYARRI